jgi:hypothetical protein
VSGYFRFHRRLGGARAWLNFSKSGVSASAGVRGLTVNSTRGVTVGLPGSGLSYRVSWPHSQAGAQHSIATMTLVAIATFCVVWFLFGAGGWVLL